MLRPKALLWSSTFDNSVYFGFVDFSVRFLIAVFDSENAWRQEADCELNWVVWIWIIGRVQSRKRDSGFIGRRAPRSMYDKFSVFHFP